MLAGANSLRRGLRRASSLGEGANPLSLAALASSPEGGAFGNAASFAFMPEALPLPLKPSPGRGKVDATKGSRRMRAQASSSLREITPHPSPAVTPSPQGVKALARPEALHFSRKLCRHAKGSLHEGAGKTVRF